MLASMTRCKALGPLMLVVPILGLAACDQTENEFVPPPPPEVTVAVPLKKMVTPYLVYSGTTEAFETVELRARVEGFLEKVEFNPGQTVTQNQVLFEIETDVFAARVAQAEAMLESANAELDLAEVTLEKSINAFNEGGMTELEIKEKTAARDQAKAGVELAEAQLDRARIDLSYCTIRAPIGGRISKNLVDAGNLVGGQGQATLLATIYATDPIFVTIDAPESTVLEFRRQNASLYQSGSIQPGQDAKGVWRRVELSVSDEEGFPHVGRIDFVDPTLDAETGTLRVRVRFDNKGGFLLPGLFARIRVARDPFEAMLVPDAALLADQQGRYALTVDAKNEVVVKRVQTGALDGELRVVRSGLDPTDRVVIAGLQRARPGAPVVPKDGKIEAAAPDASSDTEASAPKKG